MYNCPKRCFCELELGTLPKFVSLGMSFHQEENPNPNPSLSLSLASLPQEEQVANSTREGKQKEAPEQGKEGNRWKAWLKEWTVRKEYWWGKHWEILLLYFHQPRLPIPSWEMTPKLPHAHCLPGESDSQLGLENFNSFLFSVSFPWWVTQWLSPVEQKPYLGIFCLWCATW